MGLMGKSNEDEWACGKERSGWNCTVCGSLLSWLGLEDLRYFNPDVSRLVLRKGMLRYLPFPLPLNDNPANLLRRD
jgi:hypothetical protein